MSSVLLEESFAFSKYETRGPRTDRRFRWQPSLAVAAFLVVVTGLVWRTVRYALAFPIWGDESFVCVNLLDQTFGGLVGPLKVGQVAPILFWWGELAVYQILDSAEWALRLLPYLAGLAAVGLSWPLLRRALPAPASLFAWSLLAVSYYPVRHAVEIKPYSFDLLFAVALMLCAVRFLETRATGWLAALTLVTPFALLGSYPAIFIVGAIGVALLPSVWRHPYASSRVWFALFGLFGAATFLGHFLLVARQQFDVEQAAGIMVHSIWQDWFPPLDPGNFLVWLWQAHTGNMLAYPAGGPHGGSVATLLLCLVGAWAWWRGGNRTVLALIMLPFLFSLVAAILQKYPYAGSARLSQHLAPAICLLAGNGIAFLIGRLLPASQARAAYIVLFALGAFGLAGIARDLVQPYKTPAELWNRDFVRNLMENIGPEDQVVVFHPRGQVRPGIEWYLQQYPGRVAWQGEVDWDRLTSSGGKLWAVQFYFGNTAPEVIQTAVESSGLGMRLEYVNRQIGPPEHGPDPENAEVWVYRRE
ncbi:MAG: glycosyltransferase family 39 protein [Gemmataceae bacterium]|nr:glycosyltransferase family 39 protein [Gemmataceae bacterium]